MRILSRWLAAWLLIGTVQASTAATDTGDFALAMLVEALDPTEGEPDPAVARALRHLRDPQLKPTFAWLGGGSSPAMRRHGLLGVAELSNPPVLRLDQLAEIDSPSELAQLVSTGLDEGLLSDADARIMLGWPGLDVAVKELMALEMLDRGQPLGDTGWLHNTLRNEDGGRHALAALLLHELGDPLGTEALMRLLDDETDDAEAVKAVVLQTAMARRFTDVSGWALLVAEGPGSAGLREMALRVSLALGEPRAIDHWHGAWKSTDDLSERARLALLALRSAPATPDAVFETIARTDDPFLRQIAAVGLACGQERSDAAEQTAGLLRFDHPVTDAWALQYGIREAPPHIAAPLLRAMIERYTPGRPATRARRLDMAMQAAEALADGHPEVAAETLEPFLIEPSADGELLDAVMLGLIRSGSEAAKTLAGDLSVAAPSSTQLLRALVVARDVGGVTDSVLSDLDLALRGGGPLDTSLRAQAAWLYLRGVGRGADLLTALRDQP